MGDGLGNAGVNIFGIFHCFTLHSLKLFIIPLLHRAATSVRMLTCTAKSSTIGTSIGITLDTLRYAANRHPTTNFRTVGFEDRRRNPARTRVVLDVHPSPPTSGRNTLWGEADVRYNASRRKAHCIRPRFAMPAALLRLGRLSSQYNGTLVTSRRLAARRRHVVGRDLMGRTTTQA
jgi:hypothetical protein